LESPVIALVATIDGTFEVDLETEQAEPSLGDVEPQQVDTGLPRVVAAAAAGSTVAAVVDSRPPLLVSHDSGRTWRDSGRGLPTGFAVAVSDNDPDVMLFAGRNRLYLSRDGGRFWESLAVELPDIEAVAFLR
jgi:photosystem II stability/assembly factor-like uncharacterized protein